MFISAITFCGGGKAPLKTAAKTIEQRVKPIPTKDELLAKVNKYWKMIDEDPLSMYWFDKLSDAENTLKKNYPEAYKNYKNDFRLH